MTMEEDDLSEIYTSQSSNDESYIADLIREVEMKVGPIPSSLLPAAVCGPRNFLDGAVEGRARCQANFNKEGSKDSGIILGMNEDSDEFACLSKTGLNTVTNLHNTVKTNVDRNANVKQIPKCLATQKRNDRIHEIDRKLERIKDMIEEIKTSNARLMQQFLYIHDGIEEIKWVKEYHEELGSSESMAYSSRDQLSQSMDMLHQKWKHKRNQSGSRELLSLYESKVSLQNLLKAGTERTASPRTHYALGWYGKSNDRTVLPKNDLMHPEAYLNRRRSSVGEMSELSHFRSPGHGHLRRKSSAGIIITNLSRTSVSPTELNISENMKCNETLTLNEPTDKECVAL